MNYQNKTCYNIETKNSFNITRQSFMNSVNPYNFTLSCT